MPRFALSLHRMPPPNLPGDHWDLFLESPAGDLWTWSIPLLELAASAGPPTTIWLADVPLPAARRANHRREYLTYSGPISHQRGHVTLLDSGNYISRDHDSDGLPREVHLLGNQLQGTLRWILQHAADSSCHLVWSPSQPAS